MLENYIKGVSSYVSKSKLDLLNQTELVSNRDSKDNSKFFFTNVYCNVTLEGIQALDYADLDFDVWESKVIKRDFKLPIQQEIGQFEIFCRNLSFQDENRLLKLKTLLGYLLHKNKEIGESRAVILYDENMGANKQANGGSGKTLLSQALKECREIIIFDGKEIKEGSFFKNQLLELTTDIMVYDDLKLNMNFETFFPMITSGIEVEKKGKQAFVIEQSKAPKILISSNYIVKGPGGPSDSRRRHEFEIANYYSEELTPEMEFGNRFFNNDWGAEEWNKFYLFMMTCVMEYFKHGLLKAEPINLRKHRLIAESSIEFEEFAKENIIANTKYNKREMEDLFKTLYPKFADLSPHNFLK